MKNQHIPALDGVRGIAVLLVMLFHLHVPGFSLGWAGVPLFFVLSGFLITGILLNEKEKPLNVYFKQFFISRSLRIFPLYYLYLAVNALVCIAMGKSMNGYAWYVTYLQNYSIGLDASRTPGILGHTWSLAVEEQFYLLWPFLVYWLRRRLLAILCVVLIFGAPLWRHTLYAATANVYLTNTTLFSCIDMLAYGALLALLHQSHHASRIPVLAASIGFVSVALSIGQNGYNAFWQPEKWVPTTPFLMTALALTLGSLVWTAAQRRSGILSRFLSLRGLTATGRISYGLYLWHYLCFIAMEKLFTRFGDFPLLKGIVSFLLAYGVALLSYRFFELPFLRLKERLKSQDTSIAQTSYGGAGVK